MRTAAGISTEAVYIFHNMVRRLITQYQPEYLTAVFESEGPTFRDAVFEAYKANRTETPPDLLTQIPYIRKTLDAMSIPVLESSGYEADDVIGTLARRAVDEGMEVVIVSSDKDMLQLVNSHVKMLNPMKNDQWYDADETEKFLGVRPEQVIDLLALKGDTVDNIPGAPGIGDKGAKDLIATYGSVEGAMEHAEEVQRKTYRESLQNNRDKILMSKELATIHCDVPLEVNLNELVLKEPNTDALRELYRELEFTSLLRELGPSRQAPAKRDYQELGSMEELAKWIAGLPTSPGKDPQVAVAVGDAEGDLIETPATVAVCAEEGVVRYAPASVLPPGITVCHDLKRMTHRFGAEAVAGLQQDVMLEAFLLAADPSGTGLDTLTERKLERAWNPDPAAQADAVFALHELLSGQVSEAGLGELYSKIDIPMARILGEMELTGIRVDHEQLGRMSARMEEEIERLSAAIFEAAGKPFNINSPQQLGKVLFEEMGLPVVSRTGKGKAPSTSAEVLEELSSEHDIAGLVLEYRQLTKLKGTYADALPALIHEDTGRVHTTFNQCGAATGRLSSHDPNLQNIPVRTELGREIRAAFVPREGYTLVVADYSQIELRLLAHMSADPVLVEAFRNGEDIHTRTAAEVLGVPPLMITPDQRRGAKAVNFGIVYGQTAFGLAKQLGIARGEAQKYIDAYFARYSGVRKFIDKTIAAVRKSGVSVNLYGRQRPIPDMNSRNPNARGFAERTAVNTPLQGTAADMIKDAMIRIHAKLQGKQSRMLLQVHDELVFEAPPEELDWLKGMVKDEMESVQPGGAKLLVPLVVDVGTGENWRDAK